MNKVIGRAKAGVAVFQKGKALTDKKTWKAASIAVPAMGTLLVAISNLVQSFGVDTGGLTDAMLWNVAELVGWGLGLAGVWTVPSAHAGVGIKPADQRLEDGIAKLERSKAKKIARLRTIGGDEAVARAIRKVEDVSPAPGFRDDDGHPSFED